MKRTCSFLSLFLSLLFLFASCAGNGVIAPAGTPSDAQSGAGNSAVLPLTPGGSTAADTSLQTPSDAKTLLEKGDLMRGITARAPSVGKPDDAFLSAQTAFDLALFREIAEAHKGENVVLSPFSAAVALAMTANGAAGQTAKEMWKLLGGELSPDALNEGLYCCLKALTGEESALTFADAIFYADIAGFEVLPEFLQKNADYYNASAYKLPFDDEAVKAVNAWVREHTAGRIEKIIEAFGENARMLLINALCFDAEWEEWYPENMQRPGVFFTEGGEQTVTMMYSEERAYLNDGKATGFIKPYKNGYSFAALLPNENVTLDEYIASLDAASLLRTLRSAEKRRIDTGMPQFKSDFGADLKETLAALGMPAAFSLAADFSNINGKNDLYIEKVIHKCSISVDGKGTEAGAATAVEIYTKGISDNPAVVLNRPFLYMILDDSTGLPVFMGTLSSVA
ncbi:MAG: serpin family protein [Clostridia bacterium]|nr:serpin family protein [Clostridia bacterium]